MNRSTTTFLRVLTFLVFAASLLAPALPSPAAAAPFGTPLIDGVVDALYGDPIASDPAGDTIEPAPMDLLDLYITDDAENFYFAFTINTNIGLPANNWGKYLLYIDTTNDTNGAPTDAWGRNVTVSNPHKPEFSLNSWVDCAYSAACTQFWAWNGANWSQSGSIDEAALGAGDVSVLEWRISKARLGNPDTIWVEVWNTSGADGANAQDTINDPADDWNATDWSTTAILMNSTQYPPAGPGLQLIVASPSEGQNFVLPEAEVAGTVTPVEGATVSVETSNGDLFAPALNLDGAFAQVVPLLQGSNTITVTATDGVDTREVVRHVNYGAGNDGTIWQSELRHDSRDTTYRTPGGPVGVGTPVTLRLRAAANDLTDVQVRVWNDRLNTQRFYDMHVAANDGVYDWWEVTLPVSDDPTAYWYRFVAMDGAATFYYEDDGTRDGGLGQAFASSPDNSWQLTIYDDAMQTPDWVKDAVFYQIFTDRFADGNPANNPVAGEFFYADPRGTIVRSNAEEWNTYICDPRDNTDPDCASTWSQNFYGGDLQGIIDKLDYLEGIGVNALYLNPIFESPSNHKYDTTDYLQIDDAFGDLATFQTLVAEATSRGMHIVLDGVFNHVSSDSIYFDRYNRYPEVGACESIASPYRDWFYFRDVTPGTGACVGSDGTANAATYESWFGYDSLPKLKATTPAVRQLIWDTTDNASVGRYWLSLGADGWRLDVGGDVDPGTLNDPNNDYWEGFRTAVHAANPEGYIVGEEWGNASSWVVGQEWDATMNYQYSSAVMSFWRDTPFTDNDHNSGSSAGTLTPLTPSQLENRLLNWQERYPPEAYYAMMNLLGSHDTNRPLFMLDHNVTAGTSNTALYDPNYDWSDAIARLKGVTILQFTLPGAPTIYYGDEVGLVGPVTHDGSVWQDDPYNRQPFPWLDETGTPFYAHLQTEQGQAELREHYTLLANVRNQHAALRTGSFDPLLADDETMVFAYGRRDIAANDAALVFVSRSDVTETVTIDLSGYVSNNAAFVDVLNNNAAYNVDAFGSITVDIPPQFGALLVLANGDATPPDAVTDLNVLDETATTVTLGWSHVAGTPLYHVYRSLLHGGGYEEIGFTANNTFEDTGLTTGTNYYYVVMVEDGNGTVSDYSNEVHAVPHYLIGWANLQYPPAITHTIGITPTENIYGQVWIDGITYQTGATDGLWAQVGYGISGTLPVSWTTWVDASFNVDVGNNDEFKATLLPEEIGVYHYVYRYSTTNGRDWVYADQSGPIAPDILVNPGVLTVLPSGDSTPPSAPLNLMVTDWGANFIALAWDPATDDQAVYAYDIYRSAISGTLGNVIDRVYAPSVVYTDTTVGEGDTYYYTVQAVDTSFNRSAYSNQVGHKAEAKMVAVTFTVQVPDYTLGTVYIAGSLPGYPEWNPGALPMTQISEQPQQWQITLNLPDGYSGGQYKYVRGDWNTVESWGAITGFANRSLPSIAYGTDGTMAIDDTATDWGNGPDDHKAVRFWRDPLVVSFTPADGEIVTPDTAITVTWSITMSADTDFEVTGESGVVAGTFALSADGHQVVFTPAAPLAAGEYTVLVAGQSAATGDGQQFPVTWQFTVVQTEFKVFLPLIKR